MADFPRNLPPKVLAQLRGLVAAYGKVEVELLSLIEAWDFKDAAVLQAQVDEVIARLYKVNGAMVGNTAMGIVAGEFKLVDKMLKNELPMTLAPARAREVQAKMSKSLDRLPDALAKNMRDEIRNAVRAGDAINLARNPNNPLQAEIRKQLADAGVKGIVRKDGSKLGLKTSADAIVRSEAARIQNEARLERFGTQGVETVVFLAGTACRYDGEGGSCEDLDGEEWPINEIPEWAVPPRHLYGNSQLLAGEASDPVPLSEQVEALGLE